MGMKTHQHTNTTTQQHANRPGIEGLCQHVYQHLAPLSACLPALYFWVASRLFEGCTYKHTHPHCWYIGRISFCS